MNSPEPKKCIESMTFLVIDDDAVTRHMLNKILWNFGAAEVMTAESGEEGLRILHSCPVDLVFCDIMMGRMSGLKFLKLVRESLFLQDKGLNDVPIVMMTGRAEEEVVAAAGRAGADGYLIKPISVTRVSKTVARILGIDDPTSRPPCRPAEPRVVV